MPGIYPTDPIGTPMNGRPMAFTLRRVIWSTAVSLGRRMGLLWPFAAPCADEPTEPPTPHANPVVWSDATSQGFADGAAASLAFDFPTTVAGELLLLHAFSRGPLSSDPAGWTRVGTVRSHQGGVSDLYTQQAHCFTKTATGAAESGTIDQASVIGSGGPSNQRSKLGVAMYRMTGVTAATQVGWVAQSDVEDISLAVPSGANTLYLFDSVTNAIGVPAEVVSGDVLTDVNVVGDRMAGRHGTSDGFITFSPNPDSYDVGVMAVTLA